MMRKIKQSQNQKTEDLFSMCFSLKNKIKELVDFFWLLASKFKVEKKAIVWMCLFSCRNMCNFFLLLLENIPCKIKHERIAFVPPACQCQIALAFISPCTSCMEVVCEQTISSHYLFTSISVSCILVSLIFHIKMADNLPLELKLHNYDADNMSISELPFSITVPEYMVNYYVEQKEPISNTWAEQKILAGSWLTLFPNFQEAK